MTVRASCGGALALACAAVALAGCGTPSADLFAVERDGILPDAKLQMIVGDDGVITCDGKRAKGSIPDDLLLDARQLERELAPLMADELRLPVPQGAQLRYRVVSDEGEVRFADASPNLRRELGELVRFTRRVAMDSCKRAR